jgi:hypothetical protein
LKERITSLQGDLKQILVTSAETTAIAAPKLRKLSVAARARIGAAAKARWAKMRRKISQARSAVRSKRRISQTAKARLSAKAKARWKRAKAEGRTTL